MARVKLNLPEEFHFSTEIPIRIDDLNYGAHLGHDSILPFAHEARVRFLGHLGYDEKDIEGLSYIMADAAIIYKSQAFYGQTLVIEIAVQDFTRNGCDFAYRITDKETGNQIALVKTGMVFYDYRKDKISRVPERFKTRTTVKEG
ncbi:MAG: thioesterase family protein [Chloroflexi bacterium]|nr:thioesterase family protein [Chloroflexota bacterium]